MIVEWRFKVLDKYPNRIICDDGSLYNGKGKLLSLKLGKGYYLRCRMYKNSREFYTWVHRMVAYAFLGDCTNKHVHHKDRNRKNNYYTNLEIKEPEEHRNYHKNNKKDNDCPF